MIEVMEGLSQGTFHACLERLFLPTCKRHSKCKNIGRNSATGKPLMDFDSHLPRRTAIAAVNRNTFSMLPNERAQYMFMTESALNNTGFPNVV